MATKDTVKGCPVTMRKTGLFTLMQLNYPADKTDQEGGADKDYQI